MCRETDESCRKHMERLLNIWQERSLYRSDFIQQLKLAIEDSNSPRQKGAGWITHMLMLCVLATALFTGTVRHIGCSSSLGLFVICY